MKKIFFTLIVLMISMLQVEAQNKREKATLVRITTSEGDITVKLYDDTPKHKANFLKLVEDKTYEGLLFHRVIKNFMVQAGDPESRNADSLKMLGGGTLGYTIPAEIVFPKYYHKRGALAAARTGDQVNPNRESSSSQFYIVTGKNVTDTDLDRVERYLNNSLAPKEPIKYSQEQRNHYKTFGGTPHLDGTYTVFGEVVEGFDVLDKIQNQPTSANDRPKKNVVILKMKVVKK